MKGYDAMTYSNRVFRNGDWLGFANCGRNGSGNGGGLGSTYSIVNNIPSLGGCSIYGRDL